MFELPVLYALCEVCRTSRQYKTMQISRSKGSDLIDSLDGTVVLKNDIKVAGFLPISELEYKNASEKILVFIWCKNFSRKIKFSLIILNYKIDSQNIFLEFMVSIFKKTLKENHLPCASECSRKMTYSMGPINRKMINLVILILWHISLENLSFKCL